jgi:hypothetical protein
MPVETSPFASAKDMELLRLRTLIDGLMKAVEPFANWTDVVHSSWDDDVVYFDGITVGDLRRAREAYLQAHSHTEKETG